MTNLKDKVTYVLKRYPISREGYPHFMNEFTREFMPKWDGDFTKLPSTESITRAIRKAKELNPELEGIGHFHHNPKHHLKVA